MTPLADLIPQLRLRNLSISQATIEHYEAALSCVRSWAGGREPTCDEFFRLGQLQSFAGWLREPDPRHLTLAARLRRNGAPAPVRADSTVKARLDAVVSLWRLARRLRLCSHKVPARWRRPTIKVVREDPVAWSLAEVRRILEFCRQAESRDHWGAAHWYSLVSAFFVTLERAGSLLACTRSSLSAENVLTFRAEHAKERKGGAVILEPWLADMIRDLPRGDYTGERLFPWAWSMPCLRARYKRDVLVPAGLPTDRSHLLHCLRRSGVTELVNQLGLEVASRQARHSSPGLTMSRYVSKALLRDSSGTEVLSQALRPEYGGCPNLVE